MAIPGRKPRLASASGYPNYAAALVHPVFAAGFVESFYPKSLSGHISTNSIKGVNLSALGDEVIFRTEPRAQIFPYQKDQDLEISHLETSVFSMVINRAMYYNLKLDKADEKLIPNINMFIKAFLDDAQRKLAQQVDFEMLTEIPMQAAACNKGRNAGVRSGAYDLGASGAPVGLTAENIHVYLQYMRATLQEQNVDPSGMYVVLPIEAMSLFYANPILANAAASGQSKSVIFMEKIPNVLGMDIMFSNNMPQYRDPSTGKTAYLIIAGKKNATGFITKLTETEIVTDSRSFGKMWRGLSIYDFKVLVPEAISVLYATINLQP